MYSCNKQSIYVLSVCIQILIDERIDIFGEKEYLISYFVTAACSHLYRCVIKIITSISMSSCERDYIWRIQCMQLYAIIQFRSAYWPTLFFNSNVVLIKNLSFTAPFPMLWCEQNIRASEKHTEKNSLTHQFENVYKTINKTFLL